MNRPSDPQSAAFLDHIISQTRANINFLASQNYISPTDAVEIIDRLGASSQPSHVDSLANVVQTMTIAPPSGPPPGRRSVPPPAPRVNQARALWAYNENGQEPNDLSFSPGETIELVDETNADWWTGRCRGKQGLFPSNYVEKIGTASSAPSPPSQPRYVAPMPTVPVYSQPPGPPIYSPPVQSSYSPPSEKPVYKPFGAAYHGTDVPPPTGTNSIGLQQAPGQEQKKHKFGKLGNTMATSAAGGVGFGAGAAIGSGIINSIF